MKVTISISNVILYCINILCKFLSSIRSHRRFTKDWLTSYSQAPARQQIRHTSSSPPHFPHLHVLCSPWLLLHTLTFQFVYAVTEWMLIPLLCDNGMRHSFYYCTKKLMLFKLFIVFKAWRLISRWTVSGGRGVANWRCELRRWKIVAELKYMLPGSMVWIKPKLACRVFHISIFFLYQLPRDLVEFFFYPRSTAPKNVVILKISRWHSLHTIMIYYRCKFPARENDMKRFFNKRSDSYPVTWYKEHNFMNYSHYPAFRMRASS